MVRIAWRDLAGWAPTQETLRELTWLADAAVQGALDWWNTELSRRHGTPRDAQGDPVGLVVLGMGKLGGHELNFSSDIDLIFAFEEEGETDGPKPLDNSEYFTRLGQRLIRAINQLTEDGFVFRVDMRLRPWGDEGPLVMSFEQMELYYTLHGREWERYAMIKARPIAGDLAAGERLMKQLHPFVYRRYLDYGAFGPQARARRHPRGRIHRPGLPAFARRAREAAAAARHPAHPARAGRRRDPYRG
jgi:glutamate-ammonia-ligase adenylyltransferase